jgi:cbb3-type cytochrome oxidase subunit 3
MKKICPPKHIFVLFFVLFFVFSLFNKVRAATDVMSLTASPVRLGDDYSITLAPGEKKQVQVKVRNGSTEPVILESAAADFIVADDGATPITVDMTQTDNRWSLASWLTLVPAENQLASEETATVNVLIEVPENALPGGHYAMIYHRPAGAAEETGSGSGISQRVGTLLYVVVKGAVNEEAYISRFDWPKFLENGPVNFSLDIDNQSDIHINTKPVLKVYNLFGKEVANIDIESKNIFPKTQRSFEGTWNKVWGLGYYKAVVEAAYGSQGKVMTATAGLFLVPVKLILLVLIIILIGVILFLSIKKRKQSKLASSADNLQTDSKANDEAPGRSEKKE